MVALLNRKNIIGATILIIYIAFNIFLLSREIYWLIIFPISVLLFWYIFFTPRVIVLLLAFLTPLSIEFKLKEFDLGLYLPTEPIIIMLFLFIILRVFIRADFDSKILKHPISIAILIYLLIILVTSFSSVLPVVSFKFFLSRLWFIVVFYFFGIIVFDRIKTIKYFIWLFSAAMIIVVLITLFKHYQHFLTHKYAYIAPFPFFYDHTVYGAVIALILPILFGFILKYKVLEIKRYQFFITIVLLIILSFGIVFSYSRAAWVSLAVAMSFLIILLLRIKFEYLLTFLVIAVIVIAVNWTNIITPLINKDDHAISATKFRTHVESISNISTDPSNTERINRWKCAIQMFKERPLLGWGPGVYMFKYAPFQLAKDKTIISTNKGDLGNAHSEYLGPLSESGILGFLSFVSILLVVIYTGMKLYYSGNTSKIKVLSAILLLSLITYFAHGVINNFLHTDKASVPFWTFIGILAALDLKNKNNNDI